MMHHVSRNSALEAKFGSCICPRQYCLIENVKKSVVPYMEEFLPIHCIILDCTNVDYKCGDKLTLYKYLVPGLRRRDLIVTSHACMAPTYDQSTAQAWTRQDSSSFVDQQLSARLLRGERRRMRTDLLSKRIFMAGWFGLPWLWIVHVLYWKDNHEGETNQGLLNPDDRTFQ